MPCSCRYCASEYHAVATWVSVPSSVVRPCCVPHKHSATTTRLEIRIPSRLREAVLPVRSSHFGGRCEERPNVCGRLGRRVVRSGVFLLRVTHGPSRKWSRLVRLDLGAKTTAMPLGYCTCELQMCALTNARLTARGVQHVPCSTCLSRSYGDEVRRADGNPRQVATTSGNARM